MTPLFSIICPTYNRSWSIERAINSVLAQKIKNWELIIIDDGSTDNTKEIIKNYKNSNIRYFFQENAGVNSAKNSGIKKAQGKYILFLDSDDTLKTNALVTIKSNLSFFTKKISSLIYLTESPEGLITKFPNRKTPLFTYKDFIRGEWSKGEIFGCYKSEIVKEYLFPEISGGLEGIFLLRLLQVSNFYICNNSVRIYYTDHEDRLTGGGQLLDKSIEMILLSTVFLKEFKNDYIRYNKKKLSPIFFEKGIYEMINGERINAFRSLLNAMKYNIKFIIFSPIIIIIILPVPVIQFMINRIYIFKSLIYND